MKYAVVIPAKNEEANIRATVESAANQSIAPAWIVVVDDNSTDSTPRILDELSRSYANLSQIRTGSGGDYVLGGHVVRLFKQGKALLDERGVEYDWLVKLDADIEFEHDFMARIQERVQDGRFGIVSGTPYLEVAGTRLRDTSPPWHTHGQFKIYNAACYEEIGGPIENLGWDGADNIMAMSAGWECRAFSDVNYLMHRHVGGKAANRRGRMNHGISSYQLGYSKTYFALKVLHDLFKPPYVSGAYALLKGYIVAALNRYPKILSEEQERLLRHLMWSTVWDRFRNRDFALQQLLTSRRNSGERHASHRGPTR